MMDFIKNLPGLGFLVVALIIAAVCLLVLLVNWLKYGQYNRRRP